jgi:hypothetical protein
MKSKGGKKMAELSGLDLLYLYPLDHERQMRAYWAGIRRDCDKILRAMEKEEKTLRQVESGYYEALHPPEERKFKAYEGLKCQICGNSLPTQDFGRPKKYCPQCFAKMRKQYQHHKYVERLKR